MEALRTVCDVQVYNMLKQQTVTNKPVVVSKYRTFIESLNIPHEIKVLLQFSTWMTKVIDSGARIRRSKGKMSDEDYTKYLITNSKFMDEQIGITIILGEGINLVILDNHIWVMPYASILLIQNKIADIISDLLFAKFCSGVSLPTDAYEKTLRLISEFGSLLIEHKNDYFAIAKSLENLCIAESIAQHEDWSNKES